MASLGVRGGVIKACDDKCGCTVPCPGDPTCRCSSKEIEDEHKKCSCGEHCGCNPCTFGSCAARPSAAKAYCNCASGCTCVTCST